MIEFEQVSLKYGDKIIFNDLTFKVNKGEHVCIRGTSGSGKTSLLRMLQGYILPDKGTLRINGHKITPSHIKATRLKIAYLPQNVHLPVKNLEELVHLLVPSDSMKSMIHEISLLLEKSGLSDNYLTESFDNISGGEKQRCLLSFCIALPRSVLLLDEPTSSLDEKNTKIINQIISNLEHKTILSASHDPFWVSNCKRVIRLSENGLKNAENE